MITGKRLRTPEVARRLGVSVEDVYRLIFAGELAGGPGEDGVVYVTEQDLRAHQLTAERALGRTFGALPDLEVPRRDEWDREGRS